jgi:hypothetical protein
VKQGLSFQGEKRLRIHEKKKFDYEKARQEMNAENYIIRSFTICTLH